MCFPLWDTEPNASKHATQLETFGAHVAGETLREVIPTKKKIKKCLLSPGEICPVVFLQRAAERCSGGIVTLRLLCMNNISCAIICVFLVAKLHTRTEKDEEGLQP